MKTKIIQILWSIDMYPMEIKESIEQNTSILEMLKSGFLIAGMKSPNRNPLHFSYQDLMFDFDLPYGKITKIERNSRGYFATVEYDENIWNDFFESDNLVVHPLVVYDGEATSSQRRFQIICFHLYKRLLNLKRVYNGVEYKEGLRDTRDNNIGETVYE